jgi:hypothetical protein
VLQAISDYYRFPDSTIALFRNDGPESDPGFFKFEGITCFGKCSTPLAPTDLGPLLDCKASSQTREPALGIDFDPDELAANFRLERYLNAGRDSAARNVMRRSARAAYYALRPMLPVALRKHIQRLNARGWKEVTFPQWPIDTSLDRLFERLLLRAMQSCGIERLPFIWFWPDGHQAAAILTHDVETTAGRDFCTRLMDLSASWELSGSFQVVPEERYEVPQSYLDEIRDRGFEVNVHDFNHDGKLFLNKDEFTRRAAKINDYAKLFGAVGFRSAVLYRNLEWLEALDFVYDMSVPNSAPLDPQRGGCCTVMPYCIGGLVELPLTTVQDYSLFHVLGKYDMEIWERQINSITSLHGLLTFLIHPDYIIDSRAQDTYRRLLERLRKCAIQQDWWFPLPRDVAGWWKQRDEMRLIKTSAGWEIVGNGAERARIAWAIPEKDQLIYSVDSSCAVA